MSIILYPTLNNRREFIHNCWKIAQAKDNSELKQAVIRDPYFYLNRDDLLNLLIKYDNEIIQEVLKLKCSFHLTSDWDYKMISIKGGQVDKNQHTQIELLDFVSVMIENKRMDKFDPNSEILFSNNFILRFLEYHQEYLQEE